MMTPVDIKNELDKYVIGHDEAKKYLSIAGYNHLKRMNGNNIKKTNVLLIGPTGSGKTYMITMLANILGVKYSSFDATQFSAIGYEGKDVEDIITDLVNNCENNEKEASRSIVYIDEIDKIRKKKVSGSFDISGLGVQQSLLKVLEGSDIPYVSRYSSNGQYDEKLNTENILFIASGAFVDLTEVSTKGLMEYGMIPEFLGRFSITAKLEALTLSHYVKILKDSEGSIIKSYKEWFLTEGIELVIHESAINFLAMEAMKRDLGARGLHIALEEALINAQFEAPSMVIKPKQIILNSINIKTKIPFWVF